MSNKNIHKYYRKMAERILDPKETRNKAKDFSQYDIALMKEHADKWKTLLDLGSGTGLLINALIGEYKHITAVEKYEQFSKFITRHDSITVINLDLIKLDQLKVETHDLVSIFGVMNFFSYNEARGLYSYVYNNLLSTNGTMIVKHQMGIKEDVYVNGHSKELKTDYYSEYRSIENEKELIRKCGFETVESIDIYPPEFNRWSNTHFYALICR